MPEQLSEIEKKLVILEGKIDETFKSAEKTRKYILWTGIITAVVIIVPLLLIPFFLPAFFASQGVDLNNLQGL